MPNAQPTQNGQPERWTAGIEQLKIITDIERRERYLSPITVNPIIRIEAIDDFILVFRANEQMPTIFNLLSKDSEPIDCHYQTSFEKKEEDGKKPVYENILWPIPCPDHPLFKGFSLEPQRGFNYENLSYWAPVASPNSRVGIYTLECEQDGTIVYRLAIPDTDFVPQFYSQHEACNKYGNYYNFSHQGNDNYRNNSKIATEAINRKNNGVIQYTLKTDGRYTCEVKTYNKNEVINKYFGTRGSQKKREIAIGEGENSLRIVLETARVSDILDHEGVINIFDNKVGQKKIQIDKFSAMDVCAVPNDPSRFLTVTGGKVHEYTVGDKTIVGHEVCKKIPDSIQHIKSICFDHNGNFLVVLHDKGLISIINYANGMVAHKVEPDFICVGPITITKSGEILVQQIDSMDLPRKYRLRSITTNMSAYRQNEAHEIAEMEIEIAERVRRSLQDGGHAALTQGFLQDESEEAYKGVPPQVAAAKRILEETMDAMIKESLESGESAAVAQIDTLLQKILFISRQPDYAMFADVFEHRVKKLREARDKLRAEEIKTELQGLMEDDAAKPTESNGGTLAALARLDEAVTRMNQLLEEGRRLSNADAGITADVIARRETLKATLARVKTQNIDALTQQAEEKLSELARLAATVDDEHILGTLWNGDLVNGINGIINALPDTGRQLELAERLKKVFDDRRRAIRYMEEERKKRKEEEYKAIEQRAQLQLDEIREQLKLYRDENCVEEFRLSSPAIVLFRGIISQLPEERANLLGTRVDDAISAAKSRLESSRHVSESEGGVVSFGGVKFPVFYPKPMQDENWKLSPTMARDGDIVMQLKSNLGRIAEIPDEVLLDPAAPLKFSQAEYAKLAQNPDSYLNKFVHNHPDLVPAPPKRNVPEMSDKWEHSGHADEMLERLALWLKLQREYKEGITILEGEAGTGKNVIIDMFAHYTNREVIAFNCNANTTKEDMTRAYDYDPIKGTYRLNSQLIEAIMAPGVILVLDEINALSPEVAKMLNSLLDYRRTIYFAEGGKFGDKKGIRVHDECLIVGTMNPQNYAGVKKLSQEVVSRAMIEHYNYPPLMKKDSKGKDTSEYRADEALMYRKYVPELKGFKRDEFIAMWNATVNGADRTNVAAFLTPDTERILRDMKTLIVTANKFRKAYMDHKTGVSFDFEELEFVFSLREGVNIVQLYATTKMDMKDAIRRVVKPKIWNEKTREQVDTVIISQV